MPAVSVRCVGPLSRRGFLKIGALTLGGLGANGLLPLCLRARETDRPLSDTSVIFIWLPGGPSHLETYDMKPDSQAEVRGEFRPMKTIVPGLEVC